LVVLVETYNAWVYFRHSSYSCLFLNLSCLVHMGPPHCSISDWTIIPFSGLARMDGDFVGQELPDDNSVARLESMKWG
jgi:hypothetical protein